MPISYETDDVHLPTELRLAIQREHDDISAAEWKRLNTPVPGGMNGGFPGLNPNFSRDLKNIRRILISKWNEEHPEGNG